MGEVCIFLKGERLGVATRMEVLWKTSLGGTMTCGGIEEEPSPTRDRTLPDMGGDPPIGLAPTPKECRTWIVLDLWILIIPTTGFFRNH